jgi:protein-tyrosine phosphatase
MFRLFSRSPKKETNAFDYSVLGADMHSHLLPGIDDGAPDLEASLQLIRGMEALGYRKLITTPHILWDMYKNTPEKILRAFDTVQEALVKEGIGVELKAAAEYYIDEHVEGLLTRKEKLLTLGDNMVLVEFSMIHAPMGVKEVLFEMQMQGYQPIVAHPERYAYLSRNKEFYDELKEAGCLFQLNILSLTGGYGRTVTELAQYLLKHDFYNFVGTDLHHSRHLDALHNPALAPALQKLQETGRLMNARL